MIDLRNEEALEGMKKIMDKSINTVFTDPPYPEVDRDYGRMSEADWHCLMHGVVKECQRVLKPKGSAIIILQPNSAKIGNMRTWLWEFMAWAGKEWNIVQDVWWHNTAAQPNCHSQRKFGLMRPSVKVCVWLGEPDCYRNQDAVLLPLKITKHHKTNELKHNPSGYTMREARCLDTAIERGGSTPFNVLLMPNTHNRKCAGSFGHGAGTPYRLTEWWVKYTSRPGDTVLDMFSGVGTTGMVCKALDRNYIGIEKDEGYHKIAQGRFRPATLASGGRTSARAFVESESCDGS